MKKVLYLAVAWIFCVLTAVFVQSCNDDCGGEPSYQHLEAVQGEVRRISGTEVQNNMPYFILEPVEMDTRIIRYDSLVLEVEHKFIAFAKPVPVPGLFEFNKALACSRVINYSKVSEIKITSDEDYNSWLPKGANLAGIMELNRNKFVSGLKVSEISPNTIPYVEPSDWYFTFTEAPQNNKVHNLTITYRLDNGKEVSATINNVTITR